MKQNNLGQFTYSYNADYSLNDDNFILAVKDEEYPDKNIIPIAYKSQEGTLLDIDPDEIGDAIIVNKGTDVLTESLDQRFVLNEIFRISQGPIRRNENYNYPKTRIFKNFLSNIPNDQVFEIFEGVIEESKSRIRINELVLSELINQVYVETSKSLFVIDKNKLIGPFIVKSRDSDGYFIVEPYTLFLKYGEYDANEDAYFEFKANSINRRIIIKDVNELEFLKELSFVSDEEIVSQFNSDISKNPKLYNLELLNNVAPYINSVINSEAVIQLNEKNNRIISILKSTHDSIVLKKNFLELLPEVKDIKVEIQSLKEQRLQASNELDTLIKKVERLEIDYAEKISEKEKLQEEVSILSIQIEDERKQNVSELDAKISELKMYRDDLDREINIEKEKKSIELNEIISDIKNKNIIKDDLSKTIETLQKDFIGDQKSAQDKLVDLVKSKTHFDFISGRDLSSSERSNFTPQEIFEGGEYIKDYVTFRNLISDKLKLQQRKFTNHFIDNLLICVHQTTLTLFAGLPGTGKTTLSKILTKSLVSKERIREIAVSRGWTSQKDLIGFSNPLTGKFYSSNTDFYSLIKQLDYEYKSDQHLNRPLSFVILDEANLSPLEHYWSTFYNLTDSNAFVNNPIKINLGQSEELEYANNLRFLGTINYDQTTEELSPRIIDRANIIRIPQTEYEISQLTTVELSPLNLSFQNCIELFSLIDYTTSPMDFGMSSGELEEKYNEIKDVYKLLKINISPRIDISIKRYCQVARRFMTEAMRPLDYCVAQRLLPLINIQGNKPYLVKLLEIIKGFNLDDSVSELILKNIIELGEKEGYYEDNYNYFLTLSNV